MRGRTCWTCVFFVLFSMECAVASGGSWPEPLRAVTVEVDRTVSVSTARGGTGDWLLPTYAVLGLGDGISDGTSGEKRLVVLTSDGEVDTVVVFSEQDVLSAEVEGTVVLWSQWDRGHLWYDAFAVDGERLFLCFPEGSPGNYNYEMQVRDGAGEVVASYPAGRTGCRLFELLAAPSGRFVCASFLLDDRYGPQLAQVFSWNGSASASVENPKRRSHVWRDDDVLVARCEEEEVLYAFDTDLD